ncbi:guanosine polyphosphate pyrophosphohydrolase [Helicobacter sp. 16-1353]|uniref:Ppx/GppA phosphatase family protein n=1 Tax=Helicobacter sp. 16-1353 TaxID=2004996 RepID=UPI000DCCBB3D|nr:Ppx/GppA phosphatase family protein [Helicobacter sp. 16-1353]RAX54837.1 guanosine polyphosphate pyrophosphohydrolase [Helicobacter sp. 16-1353]
MSKIVAVIDIGSNSARMAIFRRTSRFGFSLIFETKSKVRISQGCYENDGILQDEPINRALNAIRDFAKLAKIHNAKKLFCVATSAVRDAPNRNQFISLIKKETKVQVKVIDGQKEAFFGAVACSNLLHKKDGITIDIGGGSTECAIIENGQIKELISLNIGTIRLKELFFDTKVDIEGAKEFIQKEIDKIPSSFMGENVFGIGGTIRALTKLIMKKEKYKIHFIHGYEFEALRYISYFKRIYNSELKKLKEFGVPPDREDNIRGGALIFSMLLEKFNTKLVITSGVGVREGIFLSDLLRNQKYSFPKGFNPSYRSILDRFIIEEKLQNNVKNNAVKLFEILSPRHKIDRKYLFHLQTAAGLTKIGNYLSFYSSNEHSAYFILNALSYGYSHADRAIITLLVKYSDKKIPQDDEILHISKIMPDILILQWLSFILSIAESLSFANDSFDFLFKNNILYITNKENAYIVKEKVESLHKPEPLGIEFI